MTGIDFAPNSDPAAYREAVAFIKGDPLSLGALVTTHKMNLLKASRDLFDDLDPYAQTLRRGQLDLQARRAGSSGHAKDPITAGASLEAIVPAGHWAETGAHLCILGSGGSSLALTLYLHNKQGRWGRRAGPDRGDRPARGEPRRDAARPPARSAFPSRSTTGSRPTPAEADAIVGALPPRSMVVNATGLGKDGPGSPLTDACASPRAAWSGSSTTAATSSSSTRPGPPPRPAASPSTTAGSTSSTAGPASIAEVFDIDIPMSGPAFDALSRIARDASR